MDVVTLQDIHFSYPEDIVVFENLNFTLQHGEQVGLVGPNGSGKSTLFFIIMGLLKPQKGTVTIWEKECHNERDFESVRRRIGFLFQDPDDQLFSPTVEEDISFGPYNLGKGSDEVKHIVDNLCVRFGITKLKERVTYKLSWGQKRLVCLAGILAMKPDILILDEPTAGVDNAVKAKLISYLQETDQTLIAASHDHDFLSALCTRTHRLGE
jgi:cobalt/nickel transport system ATP-binding protein